MSKKKKTRAQKKKKGILRTKQLDTIVKLQSIHSTSLLPSTVVSNVNQEMAPIPEPSLAFSGSETKYLARDIRKCLILGGLFFALVVALYFLENHYHFLMPLGDKLMDFLLRQK